MRSVMDAIDIGALARPDVEPPVDAAGLSVISLNFDRKYILASRIAPNFLQRDALQIGFGDKRLHQPSAPGAPLDRYLRESNWR